MKKLCYLFGLVYFWLLILIRNVERKLSDSVILINLLFDFWSDDWSLLLFWVNELGWNLWNKGWISLSLFRLRYILGNILNLSKFVWILWYVMFVLFKLFLFFIVLLIKFIYCWWLKCFFVVKLNWKLIVVVGNLLGMLIKC